jgi:hypothetical protein
MAGFGITVVSRTTRLPVQPTLGTVQDGLHSNIGCVIGEVCAAADLNGCESHQDEWNIMAETCQVYASNKDAIGKVSQRHQGKDKDFETKRVAMDITSVQCRRPREFSHVA